MRWDTISRIHESAAIKSLSLWFVVIPILAKVVEAGLIPQPLKFELPFSWALFYFASLCFFISTLLYILFCPRIIKHYRSFQEFDIRDGSYEAFGPLAKALLPRIGPKEAQIFLRHHVDAKNIGFSDPTGAALEPFQVKWEGKTLQDNLEDLERSRLLRPALRDLFASIREKGQTTYPIVRFTILPLHLLGFAGLGIVILQNVYYVWHHYEHTWVTLILAK